MKKGIGILVIILIFIFPATVFATTGNAGYRDLGVIKPEVAQMDSMEDEMESMDKEETSMEKEMEAMDEKKISDEEKEAMDKKMEAMEKDSEAMDEEMDSQGEGEHSEKAPSVKMVSAGGKYFIEILTSPNPLVKGEASLAVKLTSQDGQAVEGANIKAEVQMDPDMGGHGGMSEEPVAIELKPGKEAGVYEGQLEFDSVGGWIANIEITYPDGQKESLENKLDVIYNGPNKIFLATITGIIIISIIWAQIIRNNKDNPKGGDLDVQHTA